VPALPVAFVSHGSPLSLVEAPDALACWRAIGQSLPRPQAILAISAHWEAAVPTASCAAAPATIHDFTGFPPELYRLRYPAPGAPALAERAVALLRAAGIASELDDERGLDHGAWVPLLSMFPEADIPVTQLALAGGPAEQFAVGRALAPLRHEGVLILASGAITHNFGWMSRAAGPEAEPLPQAVAFTEWVAAKVGSGDTAALLDYRHAPHGAGAHPTEDHLLPLFAALGAAEGNAPQRHPLRYAYRALAMDAYVWG
jgi:4,5-DOPA dioxygenase extradiol